MSECQDEKCPVHGSTSVRGQSFKGKVISAKPTRTVTVERIITMFVPKFERYKKARSRVHAHNPPCINAKEGDIVIIGETRRLSKTKNFAVLKIVSEEK
ncbi:MAG: 30S ribosomal protein S17 [Candidatus Diapherotrites archaeon]|nr:30S ribosomal protein S17 [Candidatus Diapherotrites archaeon]